MIDIEASILSADFAEIGAYAERAEAAGVEGIQIDIMDGLFVPNITFGPDVVKALRSRVDIILDAHLMIVDPERYIELFAKAGADRIFVHLEATRHLHHVLLSLHDLGVQAGVAINPSTPPVALEEVLDLCDLIQVMTVNPGFGGQPFIHSQVDKIRRLRAMLTERGYATPIFVDGGIDTTTAPLVVEAGATVLVAGSSIYNNSASVADNVAALRASAGAIHG